MRPGSLARWMAALGACAAMGQAAAQAPVAPRTAEPRPPAAMLGAGNGMAFVEGLVLENASSCSGPHPCYLRMVVNGRDTRVAYGAAFGGRCVQPSRTVAGRALTAGDRARAFGRLAKGKSMDVVDVCLARAGFVGPSNRPR